MVGMSSCVWEQRQVSAGGSERLNVEWSRKRVGGASCQGPCQFSRHHKSRLCLWLHPHMHLHHHLSLIYWTVSCDLDLPSFNLPCTFMDLLPYPRPGLRPEDTDSKKYVPDLLGGWNNYSVNKLKLSWDLEEEEEEDEKEEEGCEGSSVVTEGPLQVQRNCRGSAVAFILLLEYRILFMLIPCMCLFIFWLNPQRIYGI